MKNESIVTEPSQSTILFDVFKNQETKKLGRNLIIASILTILLALGIIDITEGSVLGIKIAVSKAPDLVVISTLISVYFFIYYILAIWGDIIEYKYKIRAIKESLSKIDQDNKNSFLSKKIKAKQDLSILADRFALERELIEKRKAIYDKCETEEDFENAHEYCKNDGLDQLQKQKSIVNTNFDREIVLKRNIHNIKKQSGTYVGIGIISEIIIPVLVFLYAIYSSIEALF